MSDEPRQRLSSWKEIAQYLERDVRSVMRWEKDRGLPVHRVPGGKNGRVWAYVDELDVWLTSRGGRNGLATEPDANAPVHIEPPSAPRAGALRLSLSKVALACGVVLAIGAAAIVLARRGPVVDAILERNILTAVTASGRMAWRQEIAPGEQVMPATGVWRRVADLDEDGRPELVVALSHKRTADQLPTNKLYCFDDSGRLLWSHTPEDRLRFVSGEYGAPWASWNLFVLNTSRGARVAWPVNHHTWWPSMLLPRAGEDRARHE